MRVDFKTFGTEPREQVMTGRGGQTGAAKTGGGSTSSSTSINPTINAPNTASGLDQIRLSFDETRVRSLAAQVLAQPEIRQAKVDALQQAIGNGEYSVVPSQVASSLVSDLGGEAQG